MIWLEITSAICWMLSGAIIGGVVVKLTFYNEEEFYDNEPDDEETLTDY